MKFMHLDDLNGELARKLVFVRRECARLLRLNILLI